MNKDKPVIALMYDFDRTLSTNDMQNYDFLPSLGIEPKEFWAENQTFFENENMDNLLAYMYLMIKKSKEKEVKLDRDRLVEFGKTIEYFPGVETWFDRINEYGKENNVIIEHYIISSGLKEIIEGTSIYHYFKEVYACEFLYDENKKPIWPKNVVNYTTKTQFLFRINKGVEHIYENDRLNEFVKEKDRRIPFQNMIYIGDGMTDVPCMKLVKMNGGQSIAVYERHKSVAEQLKKDERVDHIFKADYSESSLLENTVKKIIQKMKIENELLNNKENE